MIRRIGSVVFKALFLTLGIFTLNVVWASDFVQKFEDLQSKFKQNRQQFVDANTIWNHFWSSQRTQFTLDILDLEANLLTFEMKEVLLQNKTPEQARLLTPARITSPKPAPLKPISPSAEQVKVEPTKPLELLDTLSYEIHFDQLAQAREERVGRMRSSQSTLMCHGGMISLRKTKIQNQCQYKLLTARHCIEKVDEGYKISSVWFPDFWSDSFTYLGHSAPSGIDAATLELLGPCKENKIKVLTLREYNSPDEIGECFVKPRKTNVRASCADDRFTSKRSTFWAYYHEDSPMVHPGDSGSPVMDRDGNLIGIAIEVLYEIFSEGLLPKFRSTGGPAFYDFVKEELQKAEASTN